METYNGAEVIVTCAGVPIQGGGESDFIAIEYAEDSYSLLVGVDGEATRSRNNNRSARITLTLRQTSPFNDILQGFLLTDDITGSAVFPFGLFDPASGMELHAEECYVVRPPNKTFHREAGEWEWLLETPHLREARLSILSYL